MKMCCLGFSSLERTMGRQRSRIQHLSEDDANTTLIARGRKHRNFIPSLTIAGHVVADHDRMEQSLYDHFCGVFDTATSGRSTINFAALGIHQLPLADLDVAIDVGKVWNTIKELPPNRGLGPDGYTGAFYKSVWPIIQEDLMAMIQAFTLGYQRGVEKLNNALIVLLPKKMGASSPVDFRPITMIHSFTKSISKILALRLAPKLDALVDKN